jgi:hypothetical protein
MKELYFDRISNISVQGPVTSIDLARAKPIVGTKEIEFEPKIKITLTTQNLMNFIKTLNQTAEALAKNNKAENPTVEKNIQSKEKLDTKNN